MASVEQPSDKPIKPEVSVSEVIEVEKDVEYPSVTKLTLTTIAVSLAVFCMSLDNTIIATAIPTITDQFKSLGDVGWYGSAYLLTICCFQLIFGKLYSFLSVKWVFLTALFLFELGSLVCGIAPTSKALIIGRAIAGLGGAGVFSGAVLIVSKTVPLHQRPTYNGLLGAMYGISSVAGPLLGGAFTEKLTWRWCFYINLPFGLVAAVFISFFFTNPGQYTPGKAVEWKNRLREFDVLGTALLLPAVICVLLALQWGGSQYPWKDGRIIAFFVLFGVLIIAFAGVQIWKQDKATVPPHVLKQRTVWAAALYATSMSAFMFILIYYLPIWFQAIKGASAVKSGIMNLPLILAMVVLNSISGILVSAVGYYTPFMIASSIISAVGIGLMTMLTPTTPLARWIGYQVLVGAGMGMGTQQPITAVQAALPAADIPIGTAIMMFAQTMGGSIFVSVGQTVFQNQLRRNILRAIPDEGRQIAPLVSGLGATEIQDVVSRKFPKDLAKTLSAYNDSLTETWYVSVVMAGLSLVGAVFVEWISVKRNKR
ncbi:hypothetical protein VTN96DRAFT_8578 [Rasamsonia emersonii]